MSWLFSRALVEEYSAGTYLDGEQSAPLNLMPTPQAYCAPDKMTAFFRLSRFGMTFAPLTENHGEALLMWYLAGFPVKTFQWLERGQELTASAAAYGRTWLGLLAKFDLVSRSWKTVQLSLLGDSDECLVIWPRSGMTANGQCWALPMLERRTSETGSGSWPTPQTRGFTNDGDLKALGRMCQSFAEMSAMAYRAADKKKKQYWPTPTAHNAKEGGFPSEHNRNTPTLSAQAGGALNPTWVEWLMGWPLGWTDLKPLETVRFRQWQQQHGVY